MGVLRHFSAIVVGGDLAFIAAADLRVGQIFDIIADGQRELVGDKIFIHKVKRQKLRHFPDDQLCLVKGIGEG